MQTIAKLRGYRSKKEKKRFFPEKPAHIQTITSQECIKKKRKRGPF